MSVGGRGRGYQGRHHIREELPRPGDAATKLVDVATRPGEITTRVEDAAVRTPSNNQIPSNTVQRSAGNAASSGEKTPRGQRTDKTRSRDKTGEKSGRSRDPTHRTGDKSQRGDKSHRSGDKSRRADQTQRSGEQSQRSGDQTHRSEDKSQRSGDQTRHSEDKSQRSGDQIRHSEDKSQRSGDQSRHSEEKSQRLGDQTHRSGKQKHSSGDLRNRSGDQVHRSGDQVNRSGGQMHRSGDQTDRSGDQMHRTVDQTNRSGDQTHRSGEVSRSLGDNKRVPVEINSQAADMTSHLGDKTGFEDVTGDSARGIQREGSDSSTATDGSVRPVEANSRSEAGGGETRGGGGAEDEAALAELLRVEEQHVPIVAQLEQFAPGEDGIAFNRKLRDFESSLTALCQDDAQLQAVFASLRGAALGSAATARKLASVGASFTRQQRQNVLRMALLNVMQSTFAKLDVLERSSPQLLTNAAILMGDYFMEARLGNGSKVHLLCGPLLQYLRSLLASDDRRAHRALATQLMQNGRELVTTNAQDLDELSISIRIRLLAPPPASIIWLLLSADLCINKFMPLPTGLQTFYASNLDLMQDAEPAQSYSEVSYGSWKRSPEEGRGDESTGSDRVDLSQLNLSDDGSARKLRPILGAGAALSRQSNSFAEVSAAQDSLDVWNKSSLAKRYDLNSWRQQEDGREEDELTGSLSSGDGKFIPSQQFVHDGHQFPYPAQYAPQGDAYPAFGQGERFPPYPPPDGMFATPPPYVPERANPAPNEQFTNPPPYAAAPAGPFSTPPPFAPERSVAPGVATPESAEKQNFPSGDRPRRPPENWRKERGEEEGRRGEWPRQKSATEEPEEESGGCRDGSGDARPRRGAREPRPRPQEAPPRRQEKRMDVPRSHKYWDHDDRLDRDYNS